MMPIKRRHRAHVRRSDHEVSPRVLVHLLTGHSFQTLDADLAEVGEPELRESWAAWREILLAFHVFGRVPDGVDFAQLGHCQPSPLSRPWAWWRFESPESRRQVAPGPKALSQPDWFGMPSVFDGQPPAKMFESEDAYLLRHPELLLPGERAVAA